MLIDAERLPILHGGPGHDFVCVCGTMLQNINRAIIDHCGHRELHPVWDQERYKVHVPTNCYSAPFGRKLVVTDASGIATGWLARLLGTDFFKKGH